MAAATLIGTNTRRSLWRNPYPIIESRWQGNKSEFETRKADLRSRFDPSMGPVSCKTDLTLNFWKREKRTDLIHGPARERVNRIQDSTAAPYSQLKRLALECKSTCVRMAKRRRSGRRRAVRIPNYHYFLRGPVIFCTLCHPGSLSGLGLISDEHLVRLFQNPRQVLKCIRKDKPSAPRHCVDDPYSSVAGSPSTDARVLLTESTVPAQFITWNQLDSI